MFYDRKIKYFDYLENGCKIRSAGFVKIEVVDELCNIQLHINGLYATDTFSREVWIGDGENESVLGEVSLQEGKGGLQLRRQSVAGLGRGRLPYKELQSIRIKLGKDRELNCRWGEKKCTVYAPQVAGGRDRAGDKELSGKEALEIELFGMKAAEKENDNRERPGREMLSREMPGSEIDNREMLSKEMHNREMPGEEMHNREMPGKEMLNRGKPGSEIDNREILSKEMHNREMPGREMHNREMQKREMHNRDMSGNEMHNREMPGSEMHNREMPGSEMHNREMPRSEMHNREMPGSEMHNREMPGSEMYNRDIPGSEMHNRNMPGSEMYNRDIPGSEMLNREMLSKEMFHRETPREEPLDRDMPGTGLNNCDMPGMEMFNQETAGEKLNNGELSGKEITRHEEPGKEIVDRGLSDNEISRKATARQEDLGNDTSDNVNPESQEDINLYHSRELEWRDGAPEEQIDDRKAGRPGIGGIGLGVSPAELIGGLWEEENRIITAEQESVVPSGRPEIPEAVETGNKEEKYNIRDYTREYPGIRGSISEETERAVQQPDQSSQISSGREYSDPLLYVKWMESEQESRTGENREKNRVEVKKPEGKVSQPNPTVPPRIFEDKWKQLSSIYPHISPFHDERDYLSVGPADFVILHRSCHKLANNSFLLHGYYNYEHLILAKMEKRGEEVYYIGVPGNFYDREKQVALMYGFESFECKREPAEAGDYGYYMIKVEL